MLNHRHDSARPARRAQPAHPRPSGRANETATPPDRRRARRYPAADRPARLEWREGTALRSTSARLRDVSRLGAFLAGVSFPPGGAPALVTVLLEGRRPPP